MSLKVDLRVGETLTFNNGQIVVTLLEKSGQRAKHPARPSFASMMCKKCWWARYKPTCIPGITRVVSKSGAQECALGQRYFSKEFSHASYYRRCW